MTIWQLYDLMKKLESAYCGNLTIEYMHIQDTKEREWIQNKFENNQFSLTDDQRIELLKQLTKAEFFERFIHTKFPGAKRFGLDGGESFVPAMQHIIDRKARNGCEDIAIGMAHRGRLSTLANVLRKPIRSIFSQFEGMSALPKDIEASGDVKYHLGFSNDIVVDSHKVHLSLLANPSHLEAVAPLVLGKVRAKQELMQDNQRKKALGVIVHGDAAFSGQGIVSETLSLSELDGYETGGTIHVIINNQIGFTTSPHSSRSSPYCSDVAKFIQVPILHVNGDDPEAVIRAVDVACEYHDVFGHDVVLDIFCYRRYGHNEGDEPKFTQPKMYKTIENHSSICKQYEKKLIQKNVLNDQEAQIIKDDVNLFLKNEFKIVQKAKADSADLAQKADWMEGKWTGLKSSSGEDDILKPVQTGVDVHTLRAIGIKSFNVPDDFNLHSKIARQWSAKRDALKNEGDIDWALAERLAFSSLLVEGYSVRLSGQDSQRGTFSQRHGVLVDQETEKNFIGLNHLEKEQGEVTLLNSILAEYSVLGFEYGYSLANPKALVMWEVQFGDFANGAQVVVDQFISSAEKKWLRLSGLVMLLPHGFEGQGPEHSSARLERYLQMCGEGNMIVANCSTPANYFHILRRQLKAEYRKPLVLMTPKSLLRHRACVSPLRGMGSKTTFLPIITDELLPKKMRKIIFCSGKVYYDLLEHRTQNKIKDIAIIRLEQFYPFPEKLILELLNKYDQVPVVWCQEEPENMGGLELFRSKVRRCTYKVVWQSEKANLYR